MLRRGEAPGQQVGDEVDRTLKQFKVIQDVRPTADGPLATLGVVGSEHLKRDGQELGIELGWFSNLYTEISATSGLAKTPAPKGSSALSRNTEAHRLGAVFNCSRSD